MAEPYRNRGGEMPPREYGAPRQRAGWVFMAHPDLPDSDPIEVLASAIPAKEHAGWFVVGDEATEVAEDVSSWQLTEDED